MTIFSADLGIHDLWQPLTILYVMIWDGNDSTDTLDLTVQSDKKLDYGACCKSTHCVSAGDGRIVHANKWPTSPLLACGDDTRR